MPTELSEFQIAILRILWDRGEASAAEVHRVLAPTRPVAITTVATMLQRLEKRGLVTHRAEGRTFYYLPVVREEEVRRSMLGGLLRSLFADDPAAVVSELLSRRDVTPDDVARMQALIAEAGGEGERNDDR
jgi:predicted transcriptional regulator